MGLGARDRLSLRFYTGIWSLSSKSFAKGEKSSHKASGQTEYRAERGPRRKRTFIEILPCARSCMHIRSFTLKRLSEELFEFPVYM